MSFLLESKGADPNALDKDGTSPMCAAVTWGFDEIVQLLIRFGADVNVQNRGTRWTPLHAAAFQEHGKIIMALLEAGSDINRPDKEGRSPIDFASVSESIWPLFASRGCERTPKHELVKKGVLRKIESTHHDVDVGRVPNNAVSHYTRPGSAYQRAPINPYANPSKTPSLQQVDETVDPLSNENKTMTKSASFSLWRGEA